MIIATIAHQKYMLENFADAGTLLSIIHRATPVEMGYDEHKRYFHPDINHSSIQIEICECPLLETEEHVAIQTGRRRERAEQAEKAEAA